jgi:N-acetylated-alpha-linked acidic dipeptidase
MVGNHRDAWVYGAVDPGSGTAATLEMCRALGTAVKQGWKPRRTIVYASWDAEEYGLVGSTEWAEEHAGTLDEKAVMMLNVDSAVAGTELDVDGIPSLRDLVLDAAGSVDDVRTGRSLRSQWVEKRRARWASQAPIDLVEPGSHDDSRKARPSARFSPRMNSLGSGSDYTAFVDHLGVPAIDVGFSGRYGVYHSIYDDFNWMETHGDPEFLTHVMAARLYTVLAMRAAAAEVVPLTFVPYGEALHEELDDLRRIVERKARAAGPERHSRPIGFKGLPRLIDSVRAFEAQAESLDRATAALAARDGATSERLSRVNDALMRIERTFLLEDGLPGRAWFKHAIYAPGVTTGYASWPMPGVRQAILGDDGAMLAAQLPVLVGRIDAATAAMKAAESAAR